MRYYYKVVNPDCESFSAHSHGMGLKYFTTQWTIPNIGKIFVFKELEDAKRFVWNSSWGGRIFKCIVKNPRMGKYLAPLDVLAIHTFWKKNKKEYGSPVGTYYCDAVKLVEEIK